MPFTFAHPAAVLPLKKRLSFLSLPALIVGSVVPDFVYYFPISKYFNDSSHTFGGLFFFSLPIGIIIFCFYCLLRMPFIFILPEPHRLIMRKKISKIEISPFFVLSVLTSIYLGATTHILWDSFTHKTGFFVLYFDFLSHPVFKTKNSSYYIFNLLQHISTVIGLSYLYVKYYGWYKLQSSENARVRPHLPGLSVRHFIWFALAVFASASCISIANNISPETLSLWEVRRIGFQLAVHSKFSDFIIPTFIGY